MFNFARLNFNIAANKVNLGCAQLLNNAGLIAAGGAGRWQDLDRGASIFTFLSGFNVGRQSHGGRNGAPTSIDHQGIFEPCSNTISYVVTDPETRHCAVIDSVLDYDPAAGEISYQHADEVMAYIDAEDLILEWLIETHVHADHLSAAPYIQQKRGGKIGISAEITTVQQVFGKVFNAGTEFERDGSQFDHLFTDGESYQIGNSRLWQC